MARLELGSAGAALTALEAGLALDRARPGLLSARTLALTSLQRDDEAVVAQALACTPGDPGRVSVAGFSAGAIAAAYLGELRPWASIVLWSGGVLPEDRPAHPDSPAVLTIHGGAADPYQALVDGAIDYAAQAPALGVVCDHGGGHSTGLGSDGAAFLAAADVGAPHPWASGLPTWTAQHYCEVTP